MSGNKKLEIEFKDMDYTYLEEEYYIDDFFITDGMKDDERDRISELVSQLANYINVNTMVVVQSVEVKHQEGSHYLTFRFLNSETQIDDIAVEKIMDYDGTRGINLISGSHYSCVGSVCFMMDL